MQYLQYTYTKVMPSPPFVCLLICNSNVPGHPVFNPIPRTLQPHDSHPTLVFAQGSESRSQPALEPEMTGVSRKPRPAHTAFSGRAESGLGHSTSWLPV